MKYATVLSFLQNKISVVVDRSRDKWHLAKNSQKLKGKVDSASLN